MGGRAFIAIVGHGPDLEREDGAASVLRGLGADVRTLDLWDEPHRLFPDDEAESAVERRPRALLVEALDRPDLAVAALRALRREPRLEDVGAILAVRSTQVARIEPSSGFDDFVLAPYVPAELYARIRLLEWRRSEFATEERMKVGAIVIDRAAHEVLLDGAAVTLTAKEFALLAYLAERRGKVVSRDELLRRVWGNRYEGGARTVDIHVRRLRAKLGSELPLATLRGSGYKLDTNVAVPTARPAVAAPRPSSPRDASGGKPVAGGGSPSRSIAAAPLRASRPTAEPGSRPQPSGARVAARSAR
jgi:DNA-binding response OmpR family regulator